MKINKNKQWKNFEKIFDKKQITKRYQWFLYEFSKRLTFQVNEFLLGQISQIKGSKEYKKRLIVAEMRDRSQPAWWGILAQSDAFMDSSHDPNLAILTVKPRYEMEANNPIQKILIELGPWTTDTLPFLPSPRQAVVVVTDTTEEKVQGVRKKNESQISQLQSLLKQYGLDFENRIEILSRLNLVQDLKLEALQLEFGLKKQGRAHWRPSIAFAKRGAIEILKKDQSLIEAFTNPRLKKYVLNNENFPSFDLNDLKSIQDFQNKILGD